MKTKDLIEILKTFPQDWDIQIGGPSDETECYGIKGVFETSEYDWEMPRNNYAYVQIVPMPPDVGLDVLDDYMDELKMYGDRNVYNTITVWEETFWDGSKVRYKLTEEGGIEIIGCKDRRGNTIELKDIDDTPPESHIEFCGPKDKELHQVKKERDILKKQLNEMIDIFNASGLDYCISDECEGILND